MTEKAVTNKYSDEDIKLFDYLIGMVTFYLRERWKRRPEGINNQD